VYGEDVKSVTPATGRLASSSPNLEELVVDGKSVTARNDTEYVRSCILPHDEEIDPQVKERPVLVDVPNVG
jgi:hypothetical protein